MAKPLGYRIIEVDLTVPHADEKYTVGARRLSVVHVDSEAYVKLNAPDADAIRLAPGTLWTGSDLIEELYITNVAGAGILQILVGEAVCADFSAAPAGEAEAAGAVREYRPYWGAFAWRQAASATADDVADIVTQAVNGGAANVDIATLNTYGTSGHRIYAPASVSNDAQYAGGFRSPVFPLNQFNIRSGTMLPFVGPYDFMHGFEAEIMVRMLAAGAAPGLLTPGPRAVAYMGIGKIYGFGSVYQFVGVSFMADPDAGPNWFTNMAPSNDGANADTVDSDPYYERVDTGIPWADLQRLAIEVGVVGGLPCARWLADGELLHEFKGFLSPAMGAGRALSRDGTWHTLETSDMCPRFAVWRRNGGSGSYSDMLIAPNLPVRFYERDES